MKSGCWSLRNEETAKEWARSVIILKWLHYQVAMHYQKVDKYLGVPAFFFANAVGTSLVGAALTDNGLASVIITWICVASSFITAGLIGVLFYLDPSTLSQRHLDKSVYFDDIYHDLQLELSMADNLRQDPGWFLQFVQRKIALAQKQPPVVPQRFWEQRAMDVVHGHLAHDLRQMEIYMKDTFGKNAGVSALNLPISIHEQMAEENVLDDNYDQKVQCFARKETITFASPEEKTKNCDVELENIPNEVFIEIDVKNEESKDYLDGTILHDELQREMRRIRNVSKQKRYEYQRERFCGKVFPSDLEPPDVDKM